MRYDSWILIDNKNMLMCLMEHLIEITTKSSISENRYFVVLFVDLLGARRQLMDGPRDELLPGPPLARHEHESDGS